MSSSKKQKQDDAAARVTAREEDAGDDTEPEEEEEHAMGGGGGGASSSSSSAAAAAAATAAGIKRRAEALVQGVRGGGGAAAAAKRPGCLLEVRMKNLRCHALLKVPLGPATNFIGGGNGSGKSTVLLAIQLALGMPPPTGTGVVRATSKEGAAEAQVDLCNVGPEGTSFQRHLYGDVITLKRNLLYNPATQKCSATLEIEGSLVLPNGRRHKVKGPEAKHDLAALCACFNMSYDNPVMIMDQEASKKFLTGNSKDQYDYYMRATNLLAHFNQIADLKERLAAAQVGLDNHEKALAAARANAEQIQGEYKELSQVGHLDAEVVRAEQNLLWAGYLENLSSGEPLRRDADVAHKALQQAQERWDKTQNALPGFTLKLKDAALRLEAAKERSTEVAERITAAAEAAKAAQRPLVSRARALAKAEGEEKKADKKLRAAERALKAVDDAIAAALANSKLHKAKQAVEEAKARSEALDGECGAAVRSCDALEAEVEGVEEPHRAARARVEEARAAHRAAEERLASLSASAKSQDPLLAYERSAYAPAQHAARVARLVQANPGAFKQAPLGPLGALLRIKDVALAQPLEAMRAPALTMFVCTSVEDAVALERLVRDKQPALSPHLRYITIADAGPVPALDNPAALPKDCIFNALVMETPSKALALALVESLKADHMLWVKEGPEAAETRLRSVCYGGGGAGGGGGGGEEAKKYLALCPLVARHGFMEIKLGGAGSVYKSPVHTGYAYNGYIRGVSAAVDLSGAKDNLKTSSEGLRMAEAALAAATASLRSVQGELEVARKNSARLTKERERAARAYADARKAVGVAERAVEEMTEEEAKRAEAAGDVDTAAGELEAAKEAVAEAARELDALRPAAAAAEKVLDELQASHEFSEEQEAAKEVAEREAALSKIKAAEEKFQEAAEAKEEAYEKARRALESFEGNMEVERSKARGATGLTEPRPDCPTNVARAKGVLRAKEKHRDAEKSKHKGKDPEAVLKAFKDADRQVSAELAKHREVAINHAALQVSAKEGMRSFSNNRTASAAAIKEIFEKRLADKGHKGSIEFVNTKGDEAFRGSINIRVIADAAASGKGALSAKDAGSSAEQLSGGEKSLISLILLSAIAECSNPPFRVIDEFDVFQDEGTRKKSLQYLMEDAARANDAGVLTQYVLLTPHDVSQLQSQVKLDIQVFKMPGAWVGA